MSQELCWMSACDLAESIRKRRVSPVEVVEVLLAQIDRVNPRLAAIVTRVDEQARREAHLAEKAVMRGDPLGPLHGVPLVVKDVHLTRGIRTTFGSRLYEHFVPTENSILVDRLQAAGAVILGKTNTSEFGLVPLTSGALWGECHNPWNLAHNTGGSSGGSAAAVASGLCPLATGSDGGGSIRIPASFCGVFGIKPHMGRVPHVAFPRGWESLSHQGPLARTVRDAALMLDCISGPHAADRWSLPAGKRRFVEACDEPVTNLRLAWSPHLGTLPVDAEVLDRCGQAALRFEALGCQVDEVDLDLPDLGPAQQTIVLCETATAMQQWGEGWERQIDPRLARLPEKAARLTYQDLVRAHWQREEYAQKLVPLFKQYDALLTPVASITAPPIGSYGPTEIDGQRVRSLYWLGHCVPFNMTWHPAASMPVGFDGGGLPVGLQLVGRPHDESTLFQLAAAYEKAHPWCDRRPTAIESRSGKPAR